MAKQATKSKVRKQRLIWGGLVAIGVILLLIGGYLFYSRSIGFDKDANEKQQVAEYLHDRYGKKFSVSKRTYSPGSLGGDVKGFYKSIAQPIDNSSQTFEVRQYDNGNYEDDYIKAVWSKQANESPTMRKITSQLSPGAHTFVNINRVGSSTNINPRSIPRLNDIDSRSVVYAINITRTIPTLDDIPTQYKQEVVEVTHTLTKDMPSKAELRYVINMSESRFICNITNDDIRKTDQSYIDVCFKKYQGTE